MLSRGLDFLLSRIGPTIGDITGHAIGKEENILLHNTDIVTQRGQCHGLNIPAVNGNTPCLQLVKTSYQITQGTLAHTGAAHEGHGLACLYGQRKVFYHRLLAVVGEGYVFKGDFALQLACVHRIGSVGDFRL